ncbi:MAG: hypothetical protein ACREOQ_00045 [Gemmatimonadales bacterium]
MTYLQTALLVEIPIADTFGTIPWWELLLFAAAIAVIAVFAVGGTPPEPEKRGASEAAAHETRDIDRTLTAHASSLMQLVAILAAGFVSAAKIGSLSLGVICATIAALLITASLAGWALALVGHPMLIGGLHEEARAEEASKATRRVHRRARLLQVATWCSFPTTCLAVIAGSVALLDKVS